MLNDEQYDALTKPIVRVAQRLEASLLKALINCLKPIGKYADGAAEKAQALRESGIAASKAARQARNELKADASYKRVLSAQAGQYKKAVDSAVKQALKSAPPALSQVVKKTVTSAFEADKQYYKQAGQAVPVSNSALSSIAAATLKQVTPTMRTLLRSGAYKLPGGGYTGAKSVYIAQVDAAVNATVSGQKSFDSAMRDAIRQLAKDGIKTVDYESGHIQALDTAVRMNMQTAIAQLNGDVSTANAEQTGTNYVEVSKHWGARTDGSGGPSDHAAWQGQVYMISGSSAEYRNLTVATGYPGNMLGLFGYNCRHNMYPFWPGISKPNTWQEEPEPKTYNGKTYTYYQATQQQRALEREIRALKRQAVAMNELGDSPEFSKLSMRIKSREKQYAEFSNAMEIRKKPERCAFDGYNRSVAGRVADAAIGERRKT